MNLDTLYVKSFVNELDLIKKTLQKQQITERMQK